MNYDNILTELDVLIHKLDDLMDIMFESTRGIIDLGNENYELKNVINKLDIIIDDMKDSKEKNMLESAKYDVIYANLDIIENENIFDKIKKLRSAKSTLINVKSKLSIDGNL
jgi:hypothetical protein